MKCTVSDFFYYKNALEIIFNIKMHFKWFFTIKCIVSEFYNKNALQNIFDNNLWFFSFSEHLEIKIITISQPLKFILALLAGAVGSNDYSSAKG